MTLASLLLIGSPAQAGEATPRRIALVLGGGGARGAAHIGVLEVLEKLRVPVDCVAGTSMGALVSGAYAAGRTPAEMRSELAKADWNDMFQDNPPYSEINYRNKTISTRFMPGSETGVSEKGVAYQGGVVSGQKIKLFFNRLVSSDLGERNIESLPLPLSIIATDIGNGDKVVFRDGSLSKAMRASMSVPGLMAPIDHQGHKLVDGGLVDNVPASVMHGIKPGPNLVFMLSPGERWEVKAAYSQLPSRLRQLWQLISGGKGHADFPRIGQTVARSMQISSNSTLVGSRHSGDLLIQPPTVPGMALTAWKIGSAQEQAGYEYTCRWLEQQGGLEGLQAWRRSHG